MEVLKECIRIICNELQIEIPEIIVNPDKMSTATMQALYMNNTIYIANYNISPDLLFAIAHELRHSWQIKNDNSYWLKDYKTSSELAIEDYNMQRAELDAHAFATITMETLVSLKPQWEGFSPRLVAAIEYRIDELKNEGIYGKDKTSNNPQ